MSLFWRSWGLVVLLLCTVMAALILLTTLQFGAILSNFVQGRLSVLAQSTHHSFRATTGLGLPLSSVRNGPAILERARQTDPNIAAIHVFDPDGNILFSTDSHPAPSIPPDALTAHNQARNRPWRAENAHFLLSGMPIHNPLETSTLGGVLIVYPKTGVMTSVEAMGARLAVYAVLITLFMAGIALVTLRYGLRPLIAVYSGIETSLATHEQQQWRQAAGGTSHSPPAIQGYGIDTKALVSQLDTAEQQYLAAGKALLALGKSENGP